MNRSWPRILVVSVLALVFLGFTSCQSASYYTSMLKFAGKDRRERLIERVHQGREVEVEAKERFASALAAFDAMLKAPEGDELDAAYKRFRKEADSCEWSSEYLGKIIAGLEKDSNALFEEWASELEEYTNPKLRSKSEAQLTAMRKSYNDIIAKFKTSSEAMVPVLGNFDDYLLFLSRDHGARAVGTLSDTQRDLGSLAENLDKRIDSAVQEADEFLLAHEEPEPVEEPAR